ncbi:alpha/beta hydrolase [Thalassotalea sp. LPB0316]|uniref:alpha/beta fold hydrolase n=1 Tax=Thalassotalea sp. LPB0316 TaxID=2769490 RepID=UPI0018668313|nr:alpha/beta hydrolase [Thalassotalea sp. LPB0316]QOL24636.1 alpha/beta hydrolase [Thalassotalea sp. LPB0316]
MYEIKIPLAHLNVAAMSNQQQFESNKAKVIFLHGWLDNAASFTDLLPALADYHVVAIDWPGHGLSDHKSKGAYYHFVDWVDDLYQIIQALGWSSCHIVGHSMGGMIASAFSAAFPEYVRSLTLIDAFGFITDEAKNTTKQIRQGIESRFKQQQKSTKYHPNLSSAIKARVAVSDFSLKEATLIVERGTEQTEQGVVWRTDSRLRNLSPYRFTHAQAQQLMSDLAVPVQLIYGDKGMAFVSKMLEKFQGVVSQITIHKLAGGHHVHIEQPEKTTEHILSFISAH